MSNFIEVLRLGRDAETRFTQAGKQVTGFSGCYEHGFGDSKRTVWVRVSIWGERGVKIAQYLTKGSLVKVSGALFTSEYEGKTNLELDCTDVKFVGGKPQESRPAQSQKPAAQAADAFADDDLPW